MTQHRPVYMQPASGDPDITFTAQEIRRALLRTAFGLTTEGVADYDSGSFKVTQRGAGANFSVDVAAGVAAVNGDDAADQGTYLCWSDAVVNVVTPSAPASGTRVHRLVLQVRDKLHNGSFTTYDQLLSLLQDTGSGTPAEPNSAITLALISIAAGQASVTNANITNQRTRLADYAGAIKPADTSRASTTTLTVDPDLQINGLAPGSYEFAAYLRYSAGTTGDIAWTWGLSPGATMRYGDITATVSAASATDNKTVDQAGADTATAGGLPGATITPAFLMGTVVYPAGQPGLLNLQWAQNATDTTATILKAQSYIKLRRLA